MARLIVEEGGQRRGFKLGDGVLTIGSGAEARLRVSAPDVAEIHAELQVAGGRALLRARPGVVPPTVGGEPVQVEASVAYGEEIRIGSARLWLEDEGEPAGAQAPPPAAPPAAAAVRSRVDAQVSRERAIADAKRRGDKSVVHRTRTTARRGLPSIVVVLLGLGGLAAAALISMRMVRRDAERAVRVPALLDSIQTHVDDGSFELALTRLDTLPDDMEPEERARAQALREEIARRRALADVALAQSVGTEFFDVKLVRYEASHLQGSPSKAKVREFLLRAKEFRTRWPDHPQRDWVERQERRFAGMVDLSAPPTLDELEWHIACLTRNNPKDFKASIAALDQFLEHASGEDAEAAREMRAALVEERKVNHLDRMQQAEYEFKRKGDVSQAVLQLVNAILYNGDPEMTDEAADILVQIEGVDAHLRGYKELRPGVYQELILHPTVARYVEAHGI